MDSHTHSAQVGRLEVVDTGRRRRWSEDEKLKIVLESLQAARQISATAGDTAFLDRCCCNGGGCFGSSRRMPNKNVALCRRGGAGIIGYGGACADRGCRGNRDRVCSRG